MATPQEKDLITLRVPRSIVDELRTISDRESESRATVIRRLLRRGLDAERDTPRQVN